MRIARLRLSNFMCFRGEHVLDLEPKAYAVVAKLQGDDDRSNWLGKSSLLEAIDFVLYGRHRKRTEDEWITNGVGAGEVELTLDTGERFLRSRSRGKRTALYYFGAKTAMQEEAQKLLEQAVGMGPEDFSNTCYFAQKQMAHLVTAKPEERMGIVSEWLRLGPLEKCEERAREEVAKFSNKLSDLELYRRNLASRAPGDPAALRLEIDQFAAAVTKAKAAVSRLQDEVQTNAALLSGQAKVADFDALYSDGKALSELVKSKGDLEALRKTAETLGKSEATIAAALATATRFRRDREALARGKFDGHCPVMAAPCPAAAEVNKTCTKNQALVDEAVQAEANSRDSLASAEAKANAARAKVQELDRMHARLEQMRRQVETLIDEVEAARAQPPAQDPHVLRAKLDTAQAQLQEATAAHANASRALSEHDAVLKQLATSASEQTAINAELAIWREALAIFGKQGAQKKVAEASLSNIEAGANDTLEACGVDLRVQVLWSREGSGLAKACDQCGTPFPSSVKVKACSRCQAPRGPLLVNKLELALSDRSGAAEDLAGAAVQLSAASWLRADRGCGWSVALLDEPFGALDRAHRRAFGGHLASMLSQYGFEQALVVAHHADVLDSLPGRIEIVSQGGSSSVRVVA